MSNRTTWIVALASVVLVALGLVAWRSWGPGREGGRNESLSPAGVKLSSPDVTLELLDISAVANPGYTEWACFLTCLEKDGCRAEVRLAITYRSNGDDQEIEVAGRFDAGHGDTMRLGRVQRPPRVVSEIEAVNVQVIGPLQQQQAPPTPMM